ncbi:MAG TPA: hypothetical protein DCM28_23980 [Phycisphaerales bacterium]|nr:hypothetical protein [Phycisphaerales bacterium]
MTLILLTVTIPIGAQQVQTDNASSDWRSQLEDNHGLAFELGYTLIFQSASKTLDDSHSLLSGSYDFGIEWSPIENGVLAIGIEGGQIISNSRDEDLGANVGSIMGINDDLDNEDLVLSGFSWTQSFNDESWIITLGKISLSDFFDANEIANDETAQFLSTALVNNMTIPFPDDGLGINLWANLSEHFYATFGVADSNAVTTHTPFRTVVDGDFFYSAELGFINTADLTGNYRVMLWHAQTPGVDGSGVAISIDQHIASNLVVFARWGMADEQLGDFEQFASAGLGIESPFGREDCLAAIGVAWADPSDPTVDQETILEAFYRYQLNDMMHITPSIQAIFNPADSPQSDTVYVAGLRLQTTW